MVVMGYYGIGKSTLAMKNKKIVDIESAHFEANSVKGEKWEEIYVKILQQISQQGLIVFAALNWEVLGMLKEQCIDVLLVYPNKKLKRQWISRVAEQYNVDKKDSHLRAVEYMLKTFDEDIEQLDNYMSLWKYRVDDMDYNLEEVIDHFGTQRGK